jgi:hypothetical protein
MNPEKFQIKDKAHYLNLLLLKDDLTHFQELLDRPTKNTEEWLNKLRNTRQVFLILDNVREAVQKINLKGSKTYIDQTRQIRNDLLFVNHFRNKATGHLDHYLLERAVQWTPHLFSEDNKEKLEFQIIEGHRAVIEASINSFLDGEGKQKVFNTEIDLMYRPDRDLFYQWLWKIVTDSINWITQALLILSSKINFYSSDKMKKVFSIAGQTEFNLKIESDLTYNEAKTMEVFEKAISKMKEIGIQPEIIDFLEQMKKKYVI